MSVSWSEPKPKPEPEVPHRRVTDTPFYRDGDRVPWSQHKRDCIRRIREQAGRPT